MAVEIRVECKRYIGKIVSASLTFDGNVLDVQQIKDLCSYKNSDTRCLVLKNGSELDFKPKQFKGFIELSVEGFADHIRIDCDAIRSITLLETEKCE